MQTRAAACGERAPRSSARRARRRRARSRPGGYAQRLAESDRERRQASRLALDRDCPAHRLGELLHDREPEAGADRPLTAVPLVEIEALERTCAVVVLET